VRKEPLQPQIRDGVVSVALRNFYENKHRDAFVGIGLGSAENTKDARDIAEMKALSDLISSVKTHIISISRRFEQETQNGNMALYTEDFQRFILGYSNKKIRKPKFEIIDSWQDQTDIYHIAILAVKNRHQYFHDFQELSDAENEKLDSLVVIFNHYYEEMLEK
jgi:hypothetical protein